MCNIQQWSQKAKIVQHTTVVTKSKYSATYHSGLISREGEMQDPVGVSEQLRGLEHARVLPDGHVVADVAVRAHQLFVLWSPDQGTDLLRKEAGNN